MEDLSTDEDLKGMLEGIKMLQAQNKENYSRQKQLLKGYKAILEQYLDLFKENVNLKEQLSRKQDQLQIDDHDAQAVEEEETHETTSSKHDDLSTQSFTTATSRSCESLSRPQMKPGKICTYFLRGRCKYGDHCPKIHSAVENIIRFTNDLNGLDDFKSILLASEAPRAASSESAKNVHIPIVRTKIEAPDFSSLPVDGSFPDSQVPLNKQGGRLDSRIILPEDATIKDFYIEHEKHHFCNKFHLRKDCPDGDACQYSHAPLNSRQIKHLRTLARRMRCPRGPDCRSSDCILGHICQRRSCHKFGGKSGCILPFTMHLDQEDLVVASWAPADKSSSSDDHASTAAGTETNSDQVDLISFL